jgi:hypothetical protein
MCALTQGRPKAEYNCAQKDFYTVVKMGWTSYAEHLSDFSNFNTLYTAATGTAQLAAMEAANAMPDEWSRIGVYKSLRIELVPLAEACIIAWSNMSSYIREGFASDQYEVKREMAGYNYYREAEGMDWDSVNGLIVHGLVFANANVAELTAGGMPPTFIANMTAARDAFALKHIEFMDAEEQTKLMTDAKLEANNALNRALVDMFEDAKKVFRMNAAIREEFTFDIILEMVNGGGNGGGGPVSVVTKLSGVITDAFTLMPLVGAVVVVSDGSGSQQTTSGIGGFYAFSFDGLTEPVSGTVTVSHPMYVTSMRTITMNPGEVRTEDFGLIPTPPSPPTP